MVEFALIVPMLLLLVFGIIEFGYMLNRDTVISNASRDGARVASLNGTYAQIMDTITSELTGVGIGITAPDTVIRIDCKKPDDSPCNATQFTYDDLAESGSTATVKVTYTYRWITPMISSLFGTSTVLEQSTQMRVE